MKLYNELYPSYPRQIGIPFRITCETRNDFYSNINTFFKQKRVFASVYNYIPNSTYIKDLLNVDKVYFDFDGVTPDVYQEVKNFIEELGNIKHVVIFSGGGFHVYVWTKNYHKLDSKKGTLYAAHKYFESNYNLKNLDPAVVGDIARIAAVPNTYNFKRHSFCVPLTMEKFDDIDLTKKIDKQADTTKQLIYGDELFDISEFNSVEKAYHSYADLEVPEYDTVDMVESERIRDGRFYDNIPPCLQSVLDDAQDEYAGTYKRMMVITYMRDNGFPIGNIVEVITKYFIAKRRGVIEWQHCIREKQLEFIFSKAYCYAYPDCKKIKSDGLCPLSDFCYHVKEYGNKTVLRCYK